MRATGTRGIGARTGLAALLALAVLAPAEGMAQRRQGNPPPERQRPPQGEPQRAPRQDPQDRPASRETGAQTITVRVVEIAGGRAFLEPGEDAGLRVGQTVRFRAGRFRIAGVARTSAVVDLSSPDEPGGSGGSGGAPLREGDRGRAQVRARAAAQGIDTPPPLAVFRNQWDAPVRPASLEDPRTVPLGSAAPPGNLRMTLVGGFGSIVPLATGTAPVTTLALGARVHAEPWQEMPFGIDADLALALWLGADLAQDVGAGSRPLVRVRELRLRYGDAHAPLIGLGRLRYAASTLGLLDGVRVQSPLLGRGWRVAAFGGMLPDALDNRPAFDAARFGVEATYHDIRSRWRPLVNLVAHGSVFDGSLDERRLSSYARVFRGPVSLMAHAELSAFDRDNPWGSSRVELTGAGASAAVRRGPLRAGARFDLRQPERSAWLASLLPQGWLCVAVPRRPSSPPVPEPCNGAENTRHVASLDAGYELGRLAVSAGAVAVGTSTGETIEVLSVFADARLLEVLGRGRVELGVLASDGPFLDTAAVRAGAGTALRDDLDVGVYYRPAVLRYRASVDDIVEHRFGADLLYTPLATLDLALTIEGATGRDAAGIGSFATAVWRPRL